MKLNCSCNCHFTYKLNCDCCEGLKSFTPETVFNQPGSHTLVYRIGTHTTFLETMKARLGDSKFSSLKNLKTRDANDPSIAFLDAWATVADVLTFYQERIANEGFLRTAIERRSLIELARLVGYRPNPGVSASVYLAFILEEGYNLEIPIGMGVQSLSTSGKLPQVFETSETIQALAELNQLKPRISRFQKITLQEQSNDSYDLNDARIIDKVYFQGIGTNLKPNDLILLIFGDTEKEQIVRRVQSIEVQPTDERTKVLLQSTVPLREENSVAATFTPEQQIKEVLKLPEQQPANALKLERSKQQIFNPQKFDIQSRLSEGLEPGLKSVIEQILINDTVPSQLKRIEALGIKVALFGHNVQLRQVITNGTVTFEEWQLGDLSPEQRKILILDAEYDQILPESWIAVERIILNNNGESQADFYIYKVKKVANISKTDYGTIARVTQLTLYESWLTEENPSFEVIRNTTVYLHSAVLTLAPEPIDRDVPYTIKSSNTDNSFSDRTEIELDRLYEGLQPGRWLIISGERSDIPNISGVWASEVVMLAGIRQGVCPDLPNEKLHTFLKFARPLTYSYKRETVVIYGNVAKANHGETQTEILGSGDSTNENQRFVLSQSPLTYLSANSPSGAVSTLEIYVNDIQWYEVKSLIQLSPTDRCFITQIDNENNVIVIFGDGKNGARLPSGVENIKAVYRTGIGREGNVNPKQINQLMVQPLGLKGVLNPLSATGGANPESLDEIRRNIPLKTISLEQIVSVQDYAKFALCFTGIGKASVLQLADNRQQIVHITIAGADDIPIDRDSDLYRNFIQALQEFGDPYQLVKVDKRELMLLIISARLRIFPNYQWVSVALKVRTALFDKFSFAHRELGQDVILSEVISTIQQVPGVDYVDIDILDSVSEFEAKNPQCLANKLEELANVVITHGSERESLQPKQHIPVNLGSVDPMYNQQFSRIRPAQLAILSPEVEDTLILKELKK